jgi:predicted ester cyclase
MRVRDRDRHPDVARRALAFAMLFAPAAMATAAASEDEPVGESLVRRFWNAFSLAAWDDLDSLVLPTYRHHTPDSSITLNGFKNGGRWVRRGLAGYELAVDALVSRGDTVAVRWTAQGTHVASFYGERVTGKVIVTRGMNFHRIEQQRIAEDWEVIDFDGFKRQLGAAR